MKLRVKSLFWKSRCFFIDHIPEILFTVIAIVAFVVGGNISISSEPNDPLFLATFIVGGTIGIMAITVFLIALLLISMLVLLIIYAFVSVYYGISSTIRQLKIKHYTKLLEEEQK